MKRAWGFLVFFQILVVPGSVFGGTEPGYQYTFLAGALPETLYAVNSPFMVLADIYVNSTAYVEAGVQIYFTTQTELRLDHSAGSFICDGTEALPIWLLPNGTDDWAGVVVTNVNTVRTIEFHHTHINGSVPINAGIEIITSSQTANTEMVLDGVTLSGWNYGLWFNDVDLPSALTLTANNVTCTGNAYGFVVDPGYPPGVIIMQNSEATGNQLGFDTGSPIVVNWSRIYGNADYDVRVTSAVTACPSVNFQYNDWGPTTTTEMETEGLFSDIEAICDWWDDHAFSVVDYSGFSGGSTGVPSANVVPSSWTEVKSLFR